MFPDELAEFRKAHSQDRRCASLGWEFIGALWSETLSDLAGRVKVENEGSPHLSWLYERDGNEALGWMIYPGSGTTGDYPRFEVHIDSVRKQLPPVEATARVAKAAEELGKVVSWRNYLKLENRKRWNLSLKEFRPEHAAQCAISALRILTSESPPELG